MSEDSDDGYRVGYKRPPRASQFKPGNKMGRGRRKGRKSVSSLLEEKLHQKVTVMRDGKQRKVPLLEALIDRAVKLTTAGTAKDVMAMVNFIHQFMPAALNAPQDKNLTITFVRPSPSPSLRPATASPEEQGPRSREQANPRPDLFAPFGNKKGG